MGPPVTANGTTVWKKRAACSLVRFGGRSCRIRARRS